MTPETCSILVLLFLTVYLLLDGLDLGIGMVQYFVPTEKQRLQTIEKVLPFWNGNEVWLIITGGALFAFFPQAYASICSSLYIPINALLFSLIIRAISITSLCSSLLALSSFTASFALGVILYNLSSGNLLHPFHPYALLCGLAIPFILIIYAKIALSGKKALQFTLLAVALCGLAKSLHPLGAAASTTARNIGGFYLLCGLPVVLAATLLAYRLLRQR